MCDAFFAVKQRSAYIQSRLNNSYRNKKVVCFMLCPTSWTSGSLCFERNPGRSARQPCHCWLWFIGSYHGIHQIWIKWHWHKEAGDHSQLCGWDAICSQTHRGCVLGWRERAVHFPSLQNDSEGFQSLVGWDAHQWKIYVLPCPETGLAAMWKASDRKE